MIILVHLRLPTCLQTDIALAGWGLWTALTEFVSAKSNTALKKSGNIHRPSNQFLDTGSTQLASNSSILAFPLQIFIYFNGTNSLHQSEAKKQVARIGMSTYGGIYGTNFGLIDCGINVFRVQRMIHIIAVEDLPCFSLYVDHFSMYQFLNIPIVVRNTQLVC